MKLTYKTEKNVSLVAENPDEAVTKYYIDKIRSAIDQEINEFIEEVCVSMRKLKKGEKQTLHSKPITVQIERDYKEIISNAKT